MTIRGSRVVITTGDEPVWFFHEDQGPSQAFAHPGRIVLVGARTGKVRISRTINWVPLIGNRPPVFFRSAAAYESDRYRVFDRPWSDAATTNRANTRQAGDNGARQEVADALAAEKSCALRISDTLGDFYDFGRVDKTRARLGNFFEGLEKLNAGFLSRRYTTKGGKSPIAAAQDMIDAAGCKDLFIYGAGAREEHRRPRDRHRRAPGERRPHRVADPDGRRPREARPEEPGRHLQVRLRRPVQRADQRPARRRAERAPAALLGRAGLGQLHLPARRSPGRTACSRTPGNPDQLLEFTNAMLTGLEAFVRNPEEIAAWKNGQGAGASLMAWMMARALGLSPAPAFAAPLNLLKFPQPPPPPPARVQGKPENRPPNPTTGSQPTQEDTPRGITLTANDPDGDPLTFAVTDTTDHGDLTGTPPNLTYTPDQDFDGDDEFTYVVSDDKGGSASQTVKIPISPDNDAAAVTTTSSGLASTFTEDGAPVAIDDGLTVTDPDSANLQGATVSIVDGFLPGDELVFVDQNGITGTYDSGTGVLTLTGTATKANYQAALRSVEFDSTNQNPGTTRTVEFRAEDGDEAGVPAERDVTVEPSTTRPRSTPPTPRSPTPRAMGPRRSTRASRSPTSTRRPSPARPSRSPATSCRPTTSSPSPTRTASAAATTTRPAR